LPWENAQSVAFTRLEIVSRVPSEPGVFGIMDGGECLLVGESWNLKARLLDLVNVLDGQTQLSILFETCPDEERERRKEVLTRELRGSPTDAASDSVLPGLSLRDTLRRSI
jgi:hypothetical protein